MSHTNDTKSPENVGQDNSDINDPGTGWKNMPMMMAPHLTQDGQIHLYKCHRRYIHTAHGWSRTGSSCPNDAVASAGHGGKVIWMMLEAYIVNKVFNLRTSSIIIDHISAN
jgi:hypothetical protein